MGITFRALNLRYYTISGSVQLSVALMEHSFVSDTHPGLVKTVCVLMVLAVLLLLGLLELMPQPLYPVVVTGSHLIAGEERER